MPSYRGLDPRNNPNHAHIIERLLLLRAQLDRDIPARRSLEGNLLLATWNIREFDSPAYGDRLEEAFYYIAEILGRFDLIAVQEVRKDLKALERARDLLGDSWRFLVTDVAEGSAGNKERMAYLYDSRKVQFGGVAGELVIPPVRQKDPTTRKTIKVPVSQLARTPFAAGFTAGWARFMLCTVHILYGTGKGNDPDRVAEIRQIANFLRARTLDQTAWSQNLILLGDFNIFKPTDITMQALLENGFDMPEGIDGPLSLPSNAARNKFYDQIMFRVRDKRFGAVNASGVFNFFESVFTEADEQFYVPQMGERYTTTTAGKPRANPSSYYRTHWRTHQMSDHLPLWVELQIDFSDDHLKRKMERAGIAL